MADPRPRNATKLRRATRACDFCHKRSIKCVTNGANGLRCRNCVNFDQLCTYERVAKRRGVAPKAKVSISTGRTIQHQGGPSSQAWKAPYIASQAIVMSLVEVYFEIVYPIFPLFHQPTYIRKISRGEHTTDKNTFAVTMAVCALVSARVRDQAVFNPFWDIGQLSEVRSETFYDVAVEYCSNCEDRWRPHNFDMLRCCAVLALAAIQNGQIREMQLYLGKYHTLVAMDGLHDEANWPKGIGIVEKEERRRLFWSMYTLEVYSSVIWSGVMRCREQQVNVAYATELDDVLFSDSGYHQPVLSPVTTGPSPDARWGEVRTSSWLSGWNLTTDLYRVLEHVVSTFRDQKSYRKTFLGEMFGGAPHVSATSVRDSIMEFYDNLPQCFKECQGVICEPASDRYGFQAANITATVQLIRMMLLASGGGTIEERCRIASEVVDAFTHIPVAYLRAISSPLLHHLAGIGAILGSVFEEPVSDMAYRQLRVVLLSLAQLLENLDHGIHSTVSAQRLRKLVTQIDGYWNELQTRFEDLEFGITPSSNQDFNFSSMSSSRMIPPHFTSDFFEDWPWSLDLSHARES